LRLLFNPPFFGQRLSSETGHVRQGEPEEIRFIRNQRHEVMAGGFDGSRRV